MTSSKVSQLKAGLVLLMLCAPMLATEPNLPTEPNLATTEVVFETSDQSQSWLILDEKSGIPRPHISVEPEPEGVVRPTNVAIIYIHERQSRIVENYGDKHDSAMNTPAGKSMSQRQRDFIRTTQFAVVRRIEGARPFIALWLYAVSPDDAKKMAQGVIEYISEIGDINMQVTKDAIADRQRKIAAAKEKIPEKERQTSRAQSNYRNAKKLSLYSSMADDHQVEKEIRKTILEMDKMLDLLDIEIDGINAKIAAIEHFQSQGLRMESRDRLRQMMLEEKVELAGAQTRRQAVLKIKKREKDLYNLYSISTNAAKELADLKNGLRRDEQGLKYAKENLANPGPYFLPPEIRQNKVTIYPVRTD